MQRGYSGRETRYVLASAHYRQSLNFTFDALGGARGALQRLDEFQDRLGELAGGKAAAAGAALPVWAAVARDDFDRALGHDLNMSEALGALFDMVLAGNKAMNTGAVSSAEAAAVLALIAAVDCVLGFLAKPEEKPPAGALHLLDQRQQARQAKNWAEADRLRNELAGRGWIIQDTPQGPKLKRK